MTNNSPPPAPDSGSSFPDEMAQYLQVYIDESEEQLEGLVAAILELESDPGNADAIQKSFRMLHSLKGSSGMMGFETVGNLAHELESRFERCRSGQTTPDREMITLILSCVDYLRSFLERLRSGDFSEGDPAELLVRLQALEDRSRTESTAKESPVPAVGMKLPDLTMTVSGGLRLVIRFRQGLQLADLKARLIVSRLSSLGEVVGCDPPIDDAHSFDELPLFSLTMLTEHGIDEIRKVASVDGVASIEIDDGLQQPVKLSEQPDDASQPSQDNEAIVNLPYAADVIAGEQPEIVIADSDPPVVPVTRSKNPLPEILLKQEAAAVSAPTSDDAKSQSSETLRVEISRLDDLMNLVGELVVVNARFRQMTGSITPPSGRRAEFRKVTERNERLRQRFEQMSQALTSSPSADSNWQQAIREVHEDLHELDCQAESWNELHNQFAATNDAVDQLTRVSKNLQQSVLKTRMVPVGPLFSRFKRVIRDLSADRNKRIDLSIHGDRTELDKRMIDALGDPLLHLVRNSIDHGLESPEQRRAVGKPEAGTVTLEAEHRGNSVLITVRDDGAGLNVEKIRKRIVERRLVTEQQASDMSVQQVIEYIWHPGFSTAESVTEISGRGVGMDIVRSAISALNGTIDVASTPGQGTTFTIRLPLTLAIIHSLVFEHRGDFFSLPIEDVREIVSVQAEEVHVVHRNVTISVRERLIPLVSLGGIFRRQFSEEPDTIRKTDGRSGSAGKVNAVVLQSRGKTLGLSVDSLVGRADLVIKSLSENFHPIRGLSGASILGDGAVCLMLDSTALMEMAFEDTWSQADTGMTTDVVGSAEV